jgi:hypothetical protein
MPFCSGVDPLCLFGFVVKILRCLFGCHSRRESAVVFFHANSKSALATGYSTVMLTLSVAEEEGFLYLLLL